MLNQFAFENDIYPAILLRIEKQKRDIENVLEKIACGFKMTPT